MCSSSVSVLPLEGFATESWKETAHDIYKDSDHHDLLRRNDQLSCEYDTNLLNIAKNIFRIHLATQKPFSTPFDASYSNMEI